MLIWSSREVLTSTLNNFQCLFVMNKHWSQPRALSYRDSTPISFHSSCHPQTQPWLPLEEWAHCAVFNPRQMCAPAAGLCAWQRLETRSSYPKQIPAAGCQRTQETQTLNGLKKTSPVLKTICLTFVFPWKALYFSCPDTIKMAHVGLWQKLFQTHVLVIKIKPIMRWFLNPN